MNENGGFKAFLCSKIGRVVMIVVLYGILIGLLMWALSSNVGDVILGIILLSCGFFGWKALNKIQPSVFLIMPIAGWALYFLIKGLLSVIVGAFVMPFVLSKWITDLIQASLTD